MPNPFWNKKRTTAAQLYFEGIPVEEIARIIGRSATWIHESKATAEWAERQRELAEGLKALQAGEGIRNRQNQLDILQARWDKVQRIPDQRALSRPMSAHSDFQAYPEDGRLVQLPVERVVPGWDSGYLVHDVKTSKDGAYDVYSVDTGLLAEQRAIEKQAGQVAGWWTDKPEGEQEGAAVVNVYFGGPELGI